MMIRNFGILGATLVAIGVAGVTVTPAAMASPEFTAFNTETYEHPFETSIHGAQLGAGHEFTAGLGTVQCATATFTGSMTETASSTQAVGASYEECEGSFGEAAHLKMNGCEYLFHATEETGQGEYAGVVDVLCPESESVPELTTTTSGGESKCVIEIEEQEGLGAVLFNEAEGQMEVELEVEEIAHISSGGFFNCGAANGTHTNGAYRGSSKVTAFEGESMVHLQMAFGDLAANPTSFKRKVTETEKVELYSQSKSDLIIVDEKGSPAEIYKIVKPCSGVTVPCIAELKCNKEGESLYEALAKSSTDRYTTVKVGVECTA